mgnify:CR=1 FL=1
MLKFKTIFIFLIFAFLCFSDEVVNNFFDQLKNLKEKAQFLRIETIESKINGELIFSDETLRILQNPFYKIFQKSLPQCLKINGYFRGKVSSESEKFEFDYLYIYIFTDIESFVFSQIKNDVQMLIPSLGIIMNDKKENIDNFIKSQKSQGINKGILPINFLSFFFEYLTLKESEIKEKIKFEKESKRDNLKTFIYNYPYKNGNINIEIFDKFWTFSKVKVIGKDKTELILTYSVPEKEIKVSNFLPNSIILNAEKDKNRVSLNFFDINYNRLFSESDFKIKEMNFTEMVTSIYMKILKETK